MEQAYRSLGGRAIKVTHFGKYYPPDLGGIENVTACCAKGAVAHGYSATVVCFGRKTGIGQEVIDGVRVIRSPEPLHVASQPLGFAYLFRCLSSAKDSDLVHLHAPNMLGALCALLAKRSVRLIVHWHSDVVEKGFLGLLMRPLEQMLLRRSDLVIVTSERYARSSEALARFRDKTVTIPIGVPDGMSVNEEPPHLELLREQIGNKKVILAVGRLVPYKGFSVLIAAATRLPPESIVVIVGAGPLRRRLQQEIEASGLETRVLLTGRLPDNELRALFRIADVYCLPSISRAEAFGVVLIEAMAYGVPIVATDIEGSGVPWVNQHGISGFNVAPDDPIALAEACSVILCSPELRKKLSNGARKRYISEFTEEIAVKRMLKAYSRLLSAG